MLLWYWQTSYISKCRLVWIWMQICGRGGMGPCRITPWICWISFYYLHVEKVTNFNNAWIISKHHSDCAFEVASLEIQAEAVMHAIYEADLWCQTGTKGLVELRFCSMTCSSPVCWRKKKCTTPVLKYMMFRTRLVLNVIYLNRRE